MALFNDFLRALAELVAAAAWPAVVVILLYRFRDRLGDLIPSDPRALRSEV